MMNSSFTTQPHSKDGSESSVDDFYALMFYRQGCRKVQLFCESQNIDCRNFGTCVNEWVGYWCDCNMTSYVRDSRGLCTQGMFINS